MNQPSEYFLAWGNATADLVKIHNPKNKFVVCGKPSIHLERSPDADNKANKSVSVILDQNIFEDQNMTMLSIMTEYAQKNDKAIKVRFHPYNDKNKYFSVFPSIVEDDNILAAEFVVGHTSSLIYEAILYGCRVFQYRSGAPSLIPPDFILFSSLQELEDKIGRPYNMEKFISMLIRYTGDESLLKHRLFFEKMVLKY
jgi:hypothetical protein